MSVKTALWASLVLAVCCSSAFSQNADDVLLTFGDLMQVAVSKTKSTEVPRQRISELQITKPDSRPNTQRTLSDSEQKQAQNIRDGFLKFEKTEWPPAIKAAVAEWQKSRDSVLVCVESILNYRGATIQTIIQRGIGPNNSEVIGIWAQCGGATATTSGNTSPPKIDEKMHEQNEGPTKKYSLPTAPQTSSPPLTTSVPSNSVGDKQPNELNIVSVIIACIAVLIGCAYFFFRQIKKRDLFRTPSEKN